MKLNQVFLKRSKQIILDHLQLQLPTQGVVVLLGANGAGKSSLLAVMAGLSEIDGGELDRGGIKQAFLMPEPASFYPHLTVREQLQFVAGLNQVNDAKEQVERQLDQWQLLPVADKLTQHLSLGYRQRLSLAQLDLVDADLLLLDEPMNGMDPDLLQAFKQRLKQWQQHKLVVMATHIMHEAQAHADWVVVMAAGQVKYTAAYQHTEDLAHIYQTALTGEAARHINS